jgi:hypothetical protein
MTKYKITEEDARKMSNCPACGKEKSSGCIVCWNCWRLPGMPYKYFYGELQTWLDEYDRLYKK